MLSQCYLFLWAALQRENKPFSMLSLQIFFYILTSSVCSLFTCQIVSEMAMQNSVLSKDELLDSQAHIWNHLFSFIKSMSLNCAIQLEIPDIIDRHGSPMLLSELVKALPINQERTPFVYRLMRVLVHSGFFVKQSVSTTPGDNDEEGGEGYSLAPASRFLLKEEPLSVRPLLLLVMDPMILDPFEHMSKWFKNDDVTPFYTTHGRMFWDMASKEPKVNQLFNEAMASDSRLVTSVILKHYKGIFEGLDSLVDVGGGTGIVAESIAEEFPNIRCINFDLPHVVNGLVGSKKLSYVGGDMFEAIPKADAVLLKLILHDWSDEECMRILKRCREAIPSKENGGKLIIIDVVVKVHEEENDLLETQLLCDLLMMTLATGRERSENDWAKLFLDAGFSDFKITHILGLKSLIEVYP